MRQGFYYSHLGNQTDMKVTSGSTLRGVPAGLVGHAPTSSDNQMGLFAQPVVVHKRYSYPMVW